MGLRQEHWSELNRMGVPPARYIELRDVYRSDSVALQEIDALDPSATEYHEHMRRYVEALKSHNTKAETEEGAWLEEHYPDIGSEIDWERLEQEWKQPERKTRNPFCGLWRYISRHR